MGRMRSRRVRRSRESRRETRASANERIGFDDGATRRSRSTERRPVERDGFEKCIVYYVIFC